MPYHRPARPGSHTYQARHRIPHCLPSFTSPHFTQNPINKRATSASCLYVLRLLQLQRTHCWTRQNIWSTIKRQKMVKKGGKEVWNSLPFSSLPFYSVTDYRCIEKQQKLLSVYIYIILYIHLNKYLSQIAMFRVHTV